MKYEPSCAVWEITLTCNSKCIHCGSFAGKVCEDELSTNEALKLCDDLKAIGTKGVALMGGEFLLRKDWYDIASKIKKLGMKLSLITNGYLVDKKTVELFKKLNTDMVGISVDGIGKMHDKMRGVPGAWKMAEKAIKLVEEARLPLGIITTVTKLNIDELPKIRNFILARDILWQIQISSWVGARLNKELAITSEDFYKIGQFVNETKMKYPNSVLPVCGADDIGYFSEKLKYACNPLWEGCHAGKAVVGIKSNGNVKGCLSLPDAPEFIEGNIRTRSLVDIWNDPKAFKLNRHFKKSYLKGFCKKCKYGSKCQGGCSDVANSTTGSPYETKFCFYRIEQEKE